MLDAHRGPGTFPQTMSMNQFLQYSAFTFIHAPSQRRGSCIPRTRVGLPLCGSPGPTPSSSSLSLLFLLSTAAPSFFLLLTQIPGPVKFSVKEMARHEARVQRPESNSLGQCAQRVFRRRESEESAFNNTGEGPMPEQPGGLGSQVTVV